MASRFSLSDVGKRVHVNMDDYRSCFSDVVMVVSAPKGTIAVFSERSNSYARQAEAVRVFMAQHTGQRRDD